MEDAKHAEARARLMMAAGEIPELKDANLVRQFEKLNEIVRDELEATAAAVPQSKPVEPVMYYEPAEGTGGLPAVMCTCGQQKRHLRFKVLERWAVNHREKTGHQMWEKGQA